MGQGNVFRHDVCRRAEVADQGDGFFRRLTFFQGQAGKGVFGGEKGLAPRRRPFWGIPGDQLGQRRAEKSIEGIFQDEIGFPVGDFAVQHRGHIDAAFTGHIAAHLDEDPCPGVLALVFGHFLFHCGGKGIQVQWLVGGSVRDAHAGAHVEVVQAAAQVLEGLGKSEDSLVIGR